MKLLLLTAGSALALQDTPITKVVTLLKDLKNRIHGDEKNEQNVYNKYSCWCETTSDRKAQAIHDGRDEIGVLGTKVLELKAKIAGLSKEIQQAEEDVADSQKSLEGLTQIRKKNHEAFLALSAELEHAIEGLAKAVQVLSGAGTTEKVLLQSPAFVSVYSTIRSVISLNSISKKDLKLAQLLVSKFTPTADDGSGSYSPQSATIIGILKNMHENFVADLGEATETEKTQLDNFEKAAAKLRETIALLQEKIEKKTEIRADTQVTLADTDQKLFDTTEQLKEDVRFFDETKAACSAKAKAWTTRQDNRQEELKGIREALDILTTDANRSLFNKSIKAGQETVSSFLQVDASRAPRNKAFKIISRVATESKSLRLAALAATVKTGRFGSVIKQIDRILKEMTEENETDIENRDECQSRTHELNEENKENHYNVKVSEGVIAKKERVIAKNTKSLEEVAQTRTEALENLAQLTTQREEENADFKGAKSDDEQAIDVLASVLKTLSAYSNKAKKNKEDKAFAQEDPVFDVSEDQAPDATFTHKDHREGESKGIISILEMIQGDLKNEITQGIADEAESQLAFQAQRDSINNLVDTLNKKEIALKASNAARNGEINDERTVIAETKSDIAATDVELAGMKKGCDWLIKTFTSRAEKRTAERAALTQAKGVLAGAEASLISVHKFDDKELETVQFESLSFLQRK